MYWCLNFVSLCNQFEKCDAITYKWFNGHHFTYFQISSCHLSCTLLISISDKPSIFRKGVAEIVVMSPVSVVYVMILLTLLYRIVKFMKIPVDMNFSTGYPKFPSLSMLHLSSYNDSVVKMATST